MSRASPSASILAPVTSIAIVQANNGLIFLQTGRFEKTAGASHVVALHFGHEDGGELVRTVYGQAGGARERVRKTFESARHGPIQRVARAAVKDDGVM